VTREVLGAIRQELAGLGYVEGQIGRFRALEYLIDVDGGPTIQV
jgi:hypothetical protein